MFDSISQGKFRIVQICQNHFASKWYQQHESACDSLPGTWEWLGNTLGLLYRSSHAASFSCSTSPHLSSSLCTIFKSPWAYSVLLGLELQLVSLPSNLFLTYPFCSSLSWMMPSLNSWTPSFSLVSYYHTEGSRWRSLCGDTPNSSTPLRAFSLWFHSMVFIPISYFPWYFKISL